MTWCTWRESNPQSVSYKETATCQLAATRTWCQRLNSNQLQQGYESCDYPLRLRWETLAGVAAIEPASSCFPPQRLRPIAGGPVVDRRSTRLNVTPQLSKTKKKPGTGPGSGARTMHADPQGATPHISRFVASAPPNNAMVPSINCIFVPLSLLWSTWQDSNLHRGC